MRVVVKESYGCANAWVYLQTDYPAEVKGKIALISRGSCPFVDKSALAGKAGALAAVIYNNVADPVFGMTLGADGSPYGASVPTLGISKADGTALADKIKGGATVNADFYVKTDIQNATT